MFQTVVFLQVPSKLVYSNLVEEQSVPECESSEGLQAAVHGTGVVAGDVEIPFDRLSLNLAFNRTPVVLRARWGGVSVLGKVGPGLSEKVFDHYVLLFIKTGLEM